MTKDSSASTREQSPHVNETAQNSHVNHTRTSQTPDTQEDEWTSKAGDVNSTGEAAEAYSMRAHKEDSSGPTIYRNTRRHNLWRWRGVCGGAACLLGIVGKL